MFNEIEGMVQRVATGEVDQSSVAQAATDHVSAMDEGQVKQHLETAAANANQAGETGIAQQILSALSNQGSNPQGIKQEAISLITANPQILQHFAPDFAKGLLDRM